jgi:diacylglycerol kinase family enzyme
MTHICTSSKSKAIACDVAACCVLAGIGIHAELCYNYDAGIVNVPNGVQYLYATIPSSVRASINTAVVATSALMTTAVV